MSLRNPAVLRCPIKVVTALESAENFRIVLQVASAKYTVLIVSQNMPEGKERLAAVPTPSTQEDVPDPITVEIIPFITMRIR